MTNAEKKQHRKVRHLLRNRIAESVGPLASAAARKQFARVMCDRIYSRLRKQQPA